jgi:4-hydroxythreonine-4-phosphate dehydrogenase
VREGRAAGLATAPVTKALVDEEAGPFTGHTGYLAERLGASAVMMLASEALRVILVTEHLPLSGVAKALSGDKIAGVIEVAARGLIGDFGLIRPRLAVAALNPHAGEGGLLGREEGEVIAPGISAARERLGEAADISGPFAADSLFTPAARAGYDAAVCLYHDQALIPLKALSARAAINVTLGLPIVRTSPDHGTAYDIAGKGIADAGSMARAVILAAEIAARRGWRGAATGGL